jgi:hypothetical protein
MTMTELDPRLVMRCEFDAVDDAAAGMIASRKAAGINARGGKGRILDGVSAIQDRLKVQGDGRTRFTVDHSCVETINEFESHIWKPEKDIPIDSDNHCFSAGTAILTKRGIVQIENIFAGDYVWSPFGWSLVWQSSCTGIRKVKNYGAFTCTPDHQILTDRGLITIDALRYFDKVFAWHEPRQWYLMEFLTGVILTPKTKTQRFISEALAVKARKAALHTCIARYGNTIKGRFLTAWKCITRTLILGIMKLIIWNLSLIETMASAINGAGRALTCFASKKLPTKEPSKLQQLQKVTQDFPSGAKMVGKIGKCLNKPASLVGNNTKHPSLVEAGSVILIAKCGHSENEGTQTSNHTSHTVAETLVPTFNLNTDHGCYFANGILVCNSIASLRYLNDVLAEPSGAFKPGDVKKTQTGHDSKPGDPVRPFVEAQPGARFVPRTFNPRR